MGSISLTALELVLEEIYLQRRARLRDWQESHISRRQRVDNGLEFSDDFGEVLKCLSLVHPTWTNISHRTLGRILVFPNVTMRSAKGAIATPIFGLWTREIYLPFSRDYGAYYGSRREEELSDSDIRYSATIWNCITEVLARTPNVLSLCLQTAAEFIFNIFRCVEKLCVVLPSLSQLRTLRLYSDIGDVGDGMIFSSISEIPSFFHSLDNLPDFDCLALRYYLPCFRLSYDERVNMEHCNSGSLVVYKWLQDSPPDPYVVTRIVGDSSPLNGRIRSLADLIQSICNAPAQKDEEFLMNIAHCTEFISLKLNSGSQQFTVNAAMIGDVEMKRTVSTLPSSLEFPKWCGDVEFLQLLGPQDIVKRLYPFPTLKVFQTLVATSPGASPEKLRDEVRWFIDSLPQSLELLSVLFFWESESHPKPLLPPEMHDELDELLSTIPTFRCPNIKGLQIDMYYVSKLFRKECPLKRLVDSCENRNIPLILFPSYDPKYYGQCSPGFEKVFMVENFIN
ncbi:hypothetical protein SCHPADRAFT_679199 [Schizopora paradoxa]|uniref:Uncharacterized protein n=1 Tax=Schizopora paradoxa TaxID=27342 RepID=A0A0H2R4N1_9AGAM|nr:hypothetical protein SCHPADRAFT_679199 [Schizopora paradoxa]